MIKRDSYKAKYESVKDSNDKLIEEIARLKAENTELRWRNESLWLENKKLNTIKDRMFEAGCILAKELGRFKAENLKLKIRLDVLSKKGVSKDDIQK